MNRTLLLIAHLMVQIVIGHSSVSAKAENYVFNPSLSGNGSILVPKSVADIEEMRIQFRYDLEVKLDLADGDSLDHLRSEILSGDLRRIRESKTRLEFLLDVQTILPETYKEFVAANDKGLLGPTGPADLERVNQRIKALAVRIPADEAQILLSEARVLGRLSFTESKAKKALKKFASSRWFKRLPIVGAAAAATAAATMLESDSEASDATADSRANFSAQ